MPEASQIFLPSKQDLSSVPPRRIAKRTEPVRASPHLHKRNFRILLPLFLRLCVLVSCFFLKGGRERV